MSIDTTSEAAIFERLVLPSEPSLSPEAARSILAIGFGADDRQRMEVLAEKARRGALSADEQQEIENYERVGDFLGILQSKARVSLRQASGNHS